MSLDRKDETSAFWFANERSRRVYDDVTWRRLADCFTLSCSHLEGSDAFCREFDLWLLSCFDVLYPNWQNKLSHSTSGLQIHFACWSLGELLRYTFRNSSLMHFLNSFTINFPQFRLRYPPHDLVTALVSSGEERLQAWLIILTVAETTACLRVRGNGERS